MNINSVVEQWGDRPARENTENNAGGPKKRFESVSRDGNISYTPSAVWNAGDCARNIITDVLMRFVSLITLSKFKYIIRYSQTLGVTIIGERILYSRRVQRRGFCDRSRRDGG